MRNPPRFALVPLAVLVSTVPFALSSFVGPAGADTTPDCEAAFSTGAAPGLTYATDPVGRLAFVGQTVGLSGSWDPSAWDSLSSAVACVRVEEAFDDTLGATVPAPDNDGAFEHSFVIPEIAQHTRLCTRIRLAGDPAGEATEAVWVSKMHCFEVDEIEEEAPPSDDGATTSTTAAPSTTTTTVPAPAPVTSTATPGNDAPPATPPDTPVSPDGGGSPVGTPFDTPEATRPASPESSLGWPTTTGAVPLLPATGNEAASLTLFRHGGLFLFAGLAMLVAFGLPRRRPRSTS
jgi:hypothetical protein